jgi:hypothetical protein
MVPQAVACDRRAAPQLEDCRSRLRYPLARNRRRHQHRRTTAWGASTAGRREEAVTEDSETTAIGVLRLLALLVAQDDTARIWRKTEKAPCCSHGAFIYVGDDLLSHTLSRAVQSAQRGLTSVFGMGTGVSPAVRSPASQARAESSPQLGPRRGSTQDL